MTADDVVDVLAVYRVTRFVTRDDFPPMRTLREAAEKRLGDDWAELLTCPWCMSIWLGFAFVATRSRLPRARRPVLTALAFSAITGIISEKIES